MASGSYVEALKTTTCQAVFHSQRSNGDLHDHLTAALQGSLNGGDRQQQLHTVLSIGVASLQLFVQSNFTGPAHLVPHMDGLFPSLLLNDQSKEEFRKQVMDIVAEDTAGVYTLLKNPEYLALAKTVFIALHENLQPCPTFNWWSIRYCMIFQTIVDETNTAVYNHMMQCITSMENSSLLSEDKHLYVLFNLELTEAFLLFADTGSASAKLKLANAVVGFESQLSGAFGKRTKYQVDPKAQLLVTIEYNQKIILPGEAEGPKLLLTDLPKDCQLNDDTRLPYIKFVQEDDDKVPSLLPIEQVTLLTKMHYLRRSACTDLQLKEETKAYVNALLQHPKCWVIQFNVLRIRSKLESDESRAVDRALQQFEELVACVKREEPSRFERLKLFYASGLPAFWITRQEYGKLLVDMGCNKTALELFEELELWEDAIDCYNRIGMRQRSVVILQDLIEKRESPKLWCLLGDATDNIEHYNKAWELSKNRSSRAQRSLGDHHFYRKKYPEAIEHYTKSIEVNHLQIKVWQNLAYAALRLDDWKLCCSAYKKCTVIEPDFHEFWNNLAKAYVELKEMHKAWVCLKEAVRCKSDSWKMYENLMTVSTSLGHYSEALFAYSRLLTLKPRHINLLVISKLVDGLGIDKNDEETLVNESFYKSLVLFLSQLCQSCPSESDLWYYYGEAVSCNPSPTPESRDLACQHFRKALATGTRDGSWYKNQALIKKALVKFMRLEEALEVSIEGVPPKTALDAVKSVKMLAESVVSLARKGLCNVITGEIIESAQEQMCEAEASLIKIKSLICRLTEESAA